MRRTAEVAVAILAFSIIAVSSTTAFSLHRKQGVLSTNDRRFHSTIPTKIEACSFAQRSPKHVLRSQLHSDESVQLDDIGKFRTLMGNLYLGAGIAHAADCLVGPSTLITSAGSPPYELLPIEGKALVILWCLAGPIAFYFTRIKEDTSTITSNILNRADLGLILYGLIEIFGAYFLPEKSSLLNAIAVQVIVFGAWQYSFRKP